MDHIVGEDGVETDAREVRLKRHEYSSTASKGDTTFDIVKRYRFGQPNTRSRVALLSALLPRTGARSPLGMLDADTLRHIVVQAIPATRAAFCTVDDRRIFVRDAWIDGYPVIASCLHGLDETPGFVCVASMRVLAEWCALIQCVVERRGGERWSPDDGLKVYALYLVDFRDPLHPFIWHRQQRVNRTFHLGKQAAVVGRGSFFLIDSADPPKLFAVSLQKEEVREIVFEYNPGGYYHDPTLRLKEFGCDVAVLGNYEEAWPIGFDEDKLRPRFCPQDVALYRPGKVRISYKRYPLRIISENGDIKDSFSAITTNEHEQITVHRVEEVGLSMIETRDAYADDNLPHTLIVTSIYPAGRERDPSHILRIDLGSYEIRRKNEFVFTDTVAVAALRESRSVWDFVIFWIRHDDDGLVEVTSTHRLLPRGGGRYVVQIAGLDHAERCAFVRLGEEGIPERGIPVQTFSMVDCTVDTTTGRVLAERSWETSIDTTITGVSAMYYPIGSHLNDRFT